MDRGKTASPPWEGLGDTELLSDRTSHCLPPLALPHPSHADGDPGVTLSSLPLPSLLLFSAWAIPQVCPRTLLTLSSAARGADLI